MASQKHQDICTEKGVHDFLVVSNDSMESSAKSVSDSLFSTAFLLKEAVITPDSKPLIFHLEKECKVIKELVAHDATEAVISEAVISEAALTKDMQRSPEDKWLLILLAFFIPPLTVYLLDESDSNGIILATILTIFGCGLAGVVYAIIKVVKKYEVI
jgi:uncharacterized membrane protein YqaE (UPF0057 family)